jgi:hypothetical protein
MGAAESLFFFKIIEFKILCVENEIFVVFCRVEKYTYSIWEKF